MTAPNPQPVERKVTFATVGAYLAGVAGLAIVNAVSDAHLLGGLPDLLETMLAPLGPALVTFLAGFAARHTPR